MYFVFFSLIMYYREVHYCVLGKNSIITKEPFKRQCGKQDVATLWGLAFPHTKYLSLKPFHIGERMIISCPSYFLYYNTSLALNSYC